jgi:hypothetical protein
MNLRGSTLGDRVASDLLYRRDNATQYESLVSCRMTSINSYCTPTSWSLYSIGQLSSNYQLSKSRLLPSKLQGTLASIRPFTICPSCHLHDASTQQFTASPPFVHMGSPHYVGLPPAVHERLPALQDGHPCSSPCLHPQSRAKITRLADHPRNPADEITLLTSLNVLP